MSTDARSLRALAATVLLAVEQGQSLSQCLPPALARLAPDTRPALQALCYGACRWFHRLDDELRGRLRRPLRKHDRIIHHLMLLALFQLRFSEQARYAILNESVDACRELGKPHLAGLVNGVLRAAEREGAPAPGTTRPLQPPGLDGGQTAPQLARPLDHHPRRQQHPGPHDPEGQCPPVSPGGLPGRTGAGRHRRRSHPLRHHGHPAGATGTGGAAARLCRRRCQRPGRSRPAMHRPAGPGAGQPGTGRLRPPPAARPCAILEACPALADVVAIDESAERLPRIEDNLARLDLDATLIQADAADLERWWDGAPSIAFCWTCPAAPPA